MHDSSNPAGAAIPALHVIADDTVLARPAFLRTATAVLEVLHRHGALHLRSRQLSARALYDLASQLIGTASTPIFINDRVDIAAALSAHGVQLGARSLPIVEARNLLGAAQAVGYSAHSPEEAARAEADGANFVLLGTIYRSATHPELAPAGPGLIGQTARLCLLPIIAIGGITAARVREVQAAGASGVAVIRAVWNAPDPVQAARDFAKLMSTEGSEN